MNTTAEQNRLGLIILREIFAEEKRQFQDSSLTRKRLHTAWRRRDWQHKIHPKRTVKRWRQLDAAKDYQ